MGRQRTSLPKYLTPMMSRGLLQWQEGGKYAVNKVEEKKKY